MKNKIAAFLTAVTLTFSAFSALPAFAADSDDNTTQEEDILGDVDGVDGVTINDVSLVLQYVLDKTIDDGVLEKISLEEFKKRADVFGDGEITSKNASVILEKALLGSSGVETEDADAVVDCNLAQSDAENMKFKTVKEAIASIKTTPTENKRFVIDIMPGVYREQVVINTPYVTLRKAPKKNGEVKITWYYGTGSIYDSVNSNGYYDPSVIGDGEKKVPKDWGATFKVDKNAKGTVVKDIIFENSYNQYYTQEELDDLVEHDPDTNNGMIDRAEWINKLKADGKTDDYINKWIQSRTGIMTDPRDSSKTCSFRERAAAFHCSADKFEAYNCTFIGKQDTMGINSGREYFENCTLKGTVDYICGSAIAVFNNCDLVFDSGPDLYKESYSKDTKSSSDGGYITAPSMGPETLGYLFYKCKIIGNENIGSTQGTFGRPWGGNCGPMAVYYKTTIGKNKSGKFLITDDGWSDMSGNKKDEARFYEYGSVDESGNAIDTSKRVKNSVAPKGTVLKEYEVLEFNPYEFLKGSDDWDPMNMKDKYTEFDSIVSGITFSDDGTSDSITLPTAPNGYTYTWESDTPFAQVSDDKKTVNVIRPAYQSDPIKANVTLYVQKSGTEYGVRKTVTFEIKPNQTANNTFDTIGTISLGSASEKDVKVTISFEQLGAVIQKVDVIVPNGSTSVNYTVPYLPTGKYDVTIVPENGEFKVASPKDGTASITGSTGVNQTLDIQVNRLEEITVKTEDFSEEWAKWTAIKANDNASASVVTGSSSDTANIGVGNKVIKFTKKENTTVAKGTGFSFDWMEALKASGGSLDNTNTLKFSYDFLLEKDKNDPSGVSYMAGDYSYIDFTTKLGKGEDEDNASRYVRYGVHNGWNQFNFFSAKNTRINGDNTQFNKNSTMRNKWYHFVTDIDLKNQTVYVTVYDKANNNIINEKAFTISKPDAEGNNPNYPTAIEKALYTAVYFDKNGNTNNRIEFYIDNMEITYQDFK